MINKHFTDTSVLLERWTKQIALNKHTIVKESDKERIANLINSLSPSQIESYTRNNTPYNIVGAHQKDFERPGPS